MLGDPTLCRSNAARCLRLARRARTPEARQNFLAMAETWKKLAAELGADQALLRALSELEFGTPQGEPYDVILSALNLRCRAA